MHLKLKGYLKPKKNGQKPKYQEFDKTVEELKMIIQATKDGSSKNEIVEKLAENKEADGKNLLHLAAQYAAEHDNSNFFIKLLELNFPLYHEDDDKNFPAFYIVDVKTDSHFCSMFNALREANFDLSRENTIDETFLTKLIKSTEVSTDKIQGIISTQSVITEEMMNSVSANISTKFSERKETKKALKTLMNYAKKNFPDKEAN